MVEEISVERATPVSQARSVVNFLGVCFGGALWGKKRGKPRLWRDYLAGSSLSVSTSSHPPGSTPLDTMPDSFAKLAKRPAGAEDDEIDDLVDERFSIAEEEVTCPHSNTRALAKCFLETAKRIQRAQSYCQPPIC